MAAVPAAVLDRSALEYSNGDAGFARCESGAQSCVASTDYHDICFDDLFSHALQSYIMSPSM
jgi:hypothetical protein